MVAQSPPDAQLVLQALGPHVYGAQLWGTGETQLPVPSQSDADVAMLPAQTAGAHPVPAAWSAHAPAPSHTPVVPQVLAALAVHSSAGSVAAGTKLQVPTAPGSEHASQAPPQAPSQQNPSAQNPLAH